jgi:hemerythrin-like domain-containing protein
MINTKPIKRYPVLTEFSRDHHFGLLLVWKIRQGIKNNTQPERISSYILSYFNSDLRQHFDEEEKLLFKKLDINLRLRKRAESDHAEIYELVSLISQNSNNRQYIIQFADKLDMHIRFEERELFNYIQSNLDPDAVKEISTQFTKHTHELEAGWHDEFWFIKN